MLRVVFSLTLVALASTQACGGANSSYVTNNQKLIDQFPRFSGAQKVSLSSSHYKKPDCEEPVGCNGDGGYMTTVVYTTPTGITGKGIVDFFVSAMPNWSPTVYPTNLSGKTEYRAEFSNGSATVVLLTGELAPGRNPANAYALQVDYHAKK